MSEAACTRECCQLAGVDWRTGGQRASGGARLAADWLFRLPRWALCRLNPALPALKDDEGNDVQFRRTLLNKCQVRARHTGWLEDEGGRGQGSP